MTGSHVLDVAWLCPGCGGTVPAGGTAHRWKSGVWRCAGCFTRNHGDLPRTESRAETLPRKTRQQAYDAARNIKQHPPEHVAGLPATGRKTTRRTRYAKATNLEDLLGEWP